MFLRSRRSRRSRTGIVRKILYARFVAPIQLLRAMLAFVVDRRSDRDKHASRSPRMPVDGPQFLRPDLLIEALQRHMQLGLAVTWDHPDVQLYLHGTPISCYGLTAATEHAVRAHCWSEISDAPTIYCKVDLSCLDCGNGAGLAGRRILTFGA